MDITGATAATPADVVAALRAAQPRCGRARVLAIDGAAGAGKTTLAASVAAQIAAETSGLSVVTVHGDDLYAGWDGPFRTEFPAEVHRWILTPLARGEEIRHPVYDWAVGRYTSWREFPAPDILVLEGVGMGHRLLRPDVSLLVWVQADDVDLLQRVVARDGEQVRAPMQHFIARQEAFHLRERTHAAADLISLGG